MSMINVEDLTFSYDNGLENIFEHTSFTIDTDWKLGFIGRNGRGKTTFLNLLMGNYEYSGRIMSSVKFTYFPYVVKDESQLTLYILQSIAPMAEDWELIRECNCLEVDAEVLYRPFETLSNGEKTKVLLSALFLNDDTYILIDEPTNHLDTHARHVVAEYLKRKKGFILVSHDRIFLDSCIDHVLSINRQNIEIQQGNFSSWWQNTQMKEEYERKTNERLNREINRLSQSSAQSSYWSQQVEKSKNGTTNSGSKLDKGFVSHKAAKMMKRSKNLEKRQLNSIEEKKQLLRNVETMEDLKLSVLSHHNTTLLQLDHVSVCYDGMQLSPQSFQVQQGDRIALDGRNGSGKSSILKAILKEVDYTGNIILASNLVISYVSQDTSHLSGTLSQYATDCDIDESLFKAILRKLGFERIQFEKKMEDYSQGQKKKVLIARSLCQKAHIYLWDEPLNYIDVYARMQIEQLLLQYHPTMIFVEHDESFRNQIATKTISLTV